MHIAITPQRNTYIKMRHVLFPVYASAGYRRKSFMRGSLDYGDCFIQYDATILGESATGDFPFIFAHEKGHIALRHTFKPRQSHFQKECEADIYAIAKLGFVGYIEELEQINRNCYL